MVMITGPRQVGKTTMCRQIVEGFFSSQHFNWDVPSDRAIVQRGSWNPMAQALVFDEIHKKARWKSWLKGVVDARPEGQALLVTGSARMETWRQSGDSLAGRYFSYRLHPFSVKEWLDQRGGSDEEALDRLMRRGGFPEPCLAEDEDEAQRWRRQYFTDLLREDVLEFSRIHEINAMRLFLESLRERVGSPLSLASLSQDLGVSSNTLKHYLDILQALFIVFLVRPWHKNIARAVRQTPKVYFYDTGLVKGSEGCRFENAVAAMLLKHVHFLQDAKGQDIEMSYLRTKDGAEVDFCLSHEKRLTHLIECKLTDTTRSRALVNFAEKFPDVTAIHLVKNLRHEESRPPVSILRAAQWLGSLSA